MNDTLNHGHMNTAPLLAMAGLCLLLPLCDKFSTGLMIAGIFLWVLVSGGLMFRCLTHLAPNLPRLPVAFIVCGTSTGLVESLLRAFMFPTIADGLVEMALPLIGALSACLLLCRAGQPSMTCATAFNILRNAKAPSKTPSAEPTPGSKRVRTTGIIR